MESNIPETFWSENEELDDALADKWAFLVGIGRNLDKANGFQVGTKQM